MIGISCATCDCLFINLMGREEAKCHTICHKDLLTWCFNSKALIPTCTTKCVSHHAGLSDIYTATLCMHICPFVADTTTVLFMLCVCILSVSAFFFPILL